LRAIHTTVSLAALLAASAASAQDVPTAEEQVREDVVVTAQRDNQTQVLHQGSLGALGDRDSMDVPFAIKSYSDALILNQQPLTLGQVLENDPSVRTSLGFGNASEQFVVRGFPLYGDDIAIDGLYGIAPRQLVSPELYDQVQILNGASAFLFGAAPGGSALGGTVNLRPKRAHDRDTNRMTLNYLSDEHFGLAFDVGRRLGKDKRLGIRINGAARSGDIAVDDEFRSSVVVGTALDWRGERLRVSLDLAYQRARIQHMRPSVQLADTSAVPDAPRPQLNYGQRWNHTTLRDIFGILKAEYDIAGTFKAYASVGARDAAERGIYQGLQVDDVETGDAFVTGSNIPRNDNNEAGVAGVRGSFATGPIIHEINLGGSHVRQVNRNAFVFGSFVRGPANGNNLYAPVDVPMPVLDGFAGGVLDDPNPVSRTRLSSLFASDTLGVFDRAAELILGIRRQNIHVRSYNSVSNAQTDEYDESATTAVVGLVVHPVPSVSLYANRIEGLIQGPVAGSGTVNAGEVFAPYKSVQYEIGGKLALGRFNASLALFQTDQPQTLNELLPDGGTRFTLNGEQRNRGIELSLDGELARGLRVIAGASVTSAEQRRTGGGATDGRDAIGVPDYTANATIEWDTTFLPGFTLTGRLLQTGEQAVNLSNTLMLPEWTRFDLGARYVLATSGTPVTLRFNVDNVANDRYWASSLGGYLVQGMPRTFKASATVEF
jgi:iron complex outermembrane recepter protein